MLQSDKTEENLLIGVDLSLRVLKSVIKVTSSGRSLNKNMEKQFSV